MTKSLEVDRYKGLCIALLRDVHGSVCTAESELDRDCERAITLLDNRGMGWLTLTLPEVGKIFDRSLSLGALQPINLPGFRRIKGHCTVYPEFLQGIWQLIFKPDGRLWPDPDVAAITGLRQFFYCFKKVRLPCDPKRIAETISDFYRVESSLRLPSHSWDGNRDDDCSNPALHLSDGAAAEQGSESLFDELGNETSPDASLIEYVQHVADVLVSSFDDFVAEDWKPRHGPGAVSDGRVGKFLKYNFPTWSERLESVFPMSHFGFPNYASWVDWVNHGVGYPESAFANKEMPSRLITVPKTMKGPRLIASEPTSSQYCQQVVLHYLVRQVNRTTLGVCIDFNDQSHNQRAALEASRSGSLATIDLSSASDCVSCWLVERMFRRHRPLLEALKASRTPWISDEISGRGLTYLRKFSTMGAATTFPVQSIIYAIICIACSMYGAGVTPSSAEMLKAARGVRIFGDDIIVPKAYADDVIQVLTYLGFKINPTKTFTEGFFRESCGMDAFQGTDVTPAYVLELYDKSRPTSLESVRECSNNFFRKGYWRTADYLQKTLPESLERAIPVVGLRSGATGFVSFCGGSVDHLKKRWNEGLQRYERRCVGVTTPTVRHKPDGSANLLQYFMEAPDPSSYVKWGSGYDERPGALVRNRWVDEGDLV